MKKPTRIVAGLALAVALVLEAANAQFTAREYAARQEDIETLARAFGEMHHIRRLCEPRRESYVWRERMKGLIRLEQPTANVRQRLIDAFNDGFRRASGAYPECSRSARDYAAARASEGEEISTRLAAAFAPDE
ncbi:MAG: TIGR02301 family protein [Parvularculaceae bacterium]